KPCQRGDGRNRGGADERPCGLTWGRRSKQLAAMSDRADADVPEILGGQFRQHCSIDRVVAKRLFVLLQPETLEPRRNVHVLLRAVTTRNFANSQLGLSQPTVSCPAPFMKFTTRL